MVDQSPVYRMKAVRLANDGIGLKLREDNKQAAGSR